MTAIAHHALYRCASTRRLALVVLLSVALHLGLIGLWQSTPDSTRQSAPVVTLTLAPTPQNPAPAARPPAPESLASPEPSDHSPTNEQIDDPVPAPEAQTRPESVAPLPPAVPAIPPTPTTAAAPAESPATDAGAATAIGQPAQHRGDDPARAATQTTARAPSIRMETAKREILARIHNEIERHFSYPAMARRFNWEGEVRLGFHILASGRIEQVVVKQSSGYPILDDSAVDTLSRIGRLNEASTWLQGRSLELTLPVVYRLM